jgi:5'-3' exonuclease
MKQTQLRKKVTKRDRAIALVGVGVSENAPPPQLEAEIDELLEEIDDILEQNTTAMGITADNFVANFIQANGE